MRGLRRVAVNVDVPLLVCRVYGVRGMSIRIASVYVLTRTLFQPISDALVTWLLWHVENVARVDVGDHVCGDRGGLIGVLVRSVDKHASRSQKLDRKRLELFLKLLLISPHHLTVVLRHRSLGLDLDL